MKKNNDREVIDNKDMELDLLFGSDNTEKNRHSESDLYGDMEDDFDEELEARIASYGDDDSDDDNLMKEFISRDTDIIAESRKRVNQPGRRVDRINNKTKNKMPQKEKKSDEQVSSEGNVVDKLIQFYQRNTMNVLLCVLSVLAVILIITIILVPKGKSKSNTPALMLETTGADTTTEETTAAEQETEEVVQPEAEDSEIHNLVLSFIDAAYVKADMEQVANYVDDITNINLDKYKSRQKYIESYQNVKCYKIDSAIENAFIVFVTYDAKINNIETLAPSAETFIVVYKDSDKKMYIHNPTVGEELDGYIAEGTKISVIGEMTKDVQNRLDAALAADAELKKVFDIMSGAAQGSAEE